MREIEIKLRIESMAAARTRVRRLGFRPLGPRELERNIVFDTPAQTLRNSQQLLRLRSKGGRWWLTYKNRPEPDSRHKIRQEMEIELPEGQQLAAILDRLGYQPAFEYQKFRTEYQQPAREGKLLLDETPIGNFIELEGDPRWIDQTASELGYGTRDYILASYGALYFAWCQERGIPAEDMVFQKQVKSQKAKVRN